ncbi:hypothetical protein Daus18300_009526 [Diaporthe australafricana]|uniref:Protein kinase domain-containing protein n=1 Tax=Diaporthe australafricana TaxID=127596 RepID=A0ABR3WE89_9PEZI
MSAREIPNRKHTSSSFDWAIGSKIKDGRYGPVYLALRDDTGELITAEKLVLDERGNSSVLESVASHLDSRLVTPSQPNVVSFLEYQVKEGHIFMLSEYLPGGTLQDMPLARSFLRQIVLGLEQLNRQGFAVIFVESANVMIDNKGIVKIEAPLLDGTVSGQPLPAAILALPELVLGQQNMRKADVWLLGIIAAQTLLGDCSIAGDSSVATKLKQAQESGLELLIPQEMASKLGGQSSDFIRQCLTV